MHLKKHGIHFKTKKTSVKILIGLFLFFILTSATAVTIIISDITDSFAPNRISQWLEDERRDKCVLAKRSKDETEIYLKDQHPGSEEEDYLRRELVRIEDDIKYYCD